MKVLKMETVDKEPQTRDKELTAILPLKRRIKRLIANLLRILALQESSLPGMGNLKRQ